MNTKWIKYFNKRPENLKLNFNKSNKNKLLENLEKTLEDTGIGNIFLNKIPVAQEIRARIEKWNCTNLKASTHQWKLLE
jgi:hypothetical protein